MKVGHVLYKTNNLKAAFKAFKKLGFNVEYGSRSKPHNALIYFSSSITPSTHTSNNSILEA